MKNGRKKGQRGLSFFRCVGLVRILSELTFSGKATDDEKSGGLRGYGKMKLKGVNEWELQSMWLGIGTIGVRL